MNTTLALQNLIAGNLNTATYNYLFKYNIGRMSNKTIALPNHLTLEDISAEVIVLAYNAKDQFNKDLAYETTWYNSILNNYLKLTYKTYFKDGIKRIPVNSFASNTFKDDNNNEVSIFDTLDLVDEIDLDHILSDSNDISEVVRQFILENNLDVLYARLYQEPVGEAPNGSYRKYGLVTYEELAIQFNMNETAINNTIYKQTKKVIDNFTNNNTKIKIKTSPELLAYAKEYREANKEKLKEYQKEYRIKNKNN